MVTARSVWGLSLPFGRVPNGGGTNFAEEPFFSYLKSLFSYPVAEMPTKCDFRGLR